MLGDHELSSWNVIAMYKPDIICLGYDQHWIKQDIEDRIIKGSLPQIKILIAHAHEPNTFHSSLLSLT